MSEGNNSKPVLLAAIIIAAVFLVWSFNLVQTPFLIIALLALIVVAYLFDPGSFSDDPGRNSMERANSSYSEGSDGDWKKNSGDHSRASDEQLLEEPENHHEEYSHIEAGH